MTYTDKESVRCVGLRDICNQYSLNLAVILIAHAELRAHSDPVIPSSLPDTTTPETRLDVEKDLNCLIKRVRDIQPNYPKNINVVQLGQYTNFDYDGINVRLKTKIIQDIRNTYSGDELDFYYIMWTCLLRYKTLGLLNTNSAAIPKNIYQNLEEEWKSGPVIEAFASVFNRSLETYYGLFPDVEHPFGCVSNFFSIQPDQIQPGSLLICNPPYQLNIMNAFTDKIIDLMDVSHNLTCLVVLPAFEVSDREKLNFHGNCKNKYPTDYATDVNTGLLKNSVHNRFCAIYCKEHFPFWNMVDDQVMPLTSVLVIILSRSDDVTGITKHLPNPKKYLQCSTSTSFVHRDLDLQDITKVPVRNKLNKW